MVERSNAAAPSAQCGCGCKSQQACAGDAHSPDDLRALGWAVAVHNDYRLNGQAHTFWLLTKGDYCIKGEGRTDAEALDGARAAARRLQGSDGALKTEADLLSACLSYRHDFGLMDVGARMDLLNKASQWARAFGFSVQQGEGR